ncbi:hypothetical protein DPMN_032716 [Dreissena polymorpha]|uniref:Endonuclease/exonuclease/phosphatase domain-containing protein n=1 Tax=Dreissena polymorpha TaxID=45954 RepID=A0A9D4M5K9_DREPO|nr:hypothetical protein DPMN_032716 [Dreissena polymorpha]
MKKNWELKTDLPDHGSDRIVVMEIAANPDICIISVYLPCRRNNTKDNFCEVILEIEELLGNNSDTHALFICGDFNPSLTRQPPNDRDQIFRDLVRKHNLHTDQDGEPTFFHASGEQSAEIDYILKNKLAQEISSSVVTAGQHHFNVSDHTSVSTEIMITFHDKLNDLLTCFKPNWSKCNKDIHRASLRQLTKPIGCQTICIPERDIEQLRVALSQATVASIPRFNPTDKKKRGLLKLEVQPSKLQ